ncbi:MAG: tryptophan--tRNA ligase [Alphaproteobacteria bacterium]|jgi:tryptophanyl-tRNA synthetase|nr:tryptophan--tRNA ligase [Alphaproteobacteria bacterium]MBT5390342.1 tryptophan--tRNA ligase [Alphaproteobacteria bacterium]MBT5539968.1 tryptophan--tRNA ligase [Alphaproteobacteria bacterium]
MDRVFSGIQPTGDLHLGNYLGALRNWIGFQKTHDCLFCIVDLHSMTVPYDPEKLRNNTRFVAATYIAAGIDPNKSIIFAQSSVSEHCELAWILGCLTPLGWLNRMTHFKEKAGKHRENASLGLYAYPVLQAADILLYKATHVPIGEDQKQHLELSRDIAGTFNHRFGQEYFPLPEPLILGNATRVMSLRDGTKKMSKSDISEFSRIHLTDDPDTIRQKIRKARTDADPIPEDSKQLEERPEAMNLLNIYGALTGQSLKEVCVQFSGSNFAPFKEVLSELLIEKLSPIREDVSRLLKDSKTLDDILKSGAERAREKAVKTLEEVKGIIGVR